MSEDRSITVTFSGYHVGILYKALERLEKDHQRYAKACDRGYGTAKAEDNKKEHLNRVEEIREIQSIITEASI